MSEPRWLSEQEQRAWRGYNQMSARLTLELGRQLARDFGLSIQDYEVLVVLSEAPGGALRSRDLRYALAWEKSRLSHQVRRMEDRGLLSRSVCADDARSSVVELTEQGRACIERAAGPHVEAVRTTIIDVLTPEQVDALGDITATVLARLDELELGTVQAE